MIIIVHNTVVCFTCWIFLLKILLYFTFGKSGWKKSNIESDHLSMTEKYLRKSTLEIFASVQLSPLIHAFLFPSFSFFLPFYYFYVCWNISFLLGLSSLLPFQLIRFTSARLKVFCFVCSTKMFVFVCRFNMFLFKCLFKLFVFVCRFNMFLYVCRFTMFVCM
jgi:hypothetical protein